MVGCFRSFTIVTQNPCLCLFNSEKNTNFVTNSKVMRRIFLFLTMLLVTVMNSHGAEPLTLKDITSGSYAAERISGINPIENSDEYAQISQDGDRIEKYSFKTGQMTGVLFDRTATLGTQLEEFEDYLIAPDGQTLLIVCNTKRIYRRSFTATYYIYKVKDKSLRLLSKDGDLQVPTFSPDSKWIAFVRDNNIFITDGEQETQVTTDGQFNEVINGIPDWVNEEEFGFNNAMAWSGDCQSLCWLRYDERNVKTFSLQFYHAEENLYPMDYSYKYPKAGEDNSVVTAWSYNLASGKTQQLQIPIDADGYMPRVKSIPSSSSIIVYTMNRHQDLFRIYKVQPNSGEVRMIIEEKADKYVKEEAMEGVAIMRNHILLPSDRDGYMHLYLYDMNGRLIRQIERGNYDVTDVYGYDEATGNTYFQAAVPSPMNRALFVVDKKGKRLQVSEGEGWHSAVYSGDFQYFVHVWSDASHPYVYSVCNYRGKQIREMINNQELREKLSQFSLPEKDFFSFKTSEGVTLHGWMMKPTDFDETKKYPVIMYQYSGPGSQQVVNSWNIGSMGQGGLFDSYLTQKGFIMVTVDGRGTGARGSDFEKCTYLHIGDMESKDQVEAAIYLGSLPYVDQERIGIWGWSFGGFNTLMSMSEGRPVFKAGVAVAPPTNWKFYDSIYTERYMRTPQENPNGYAVNPIQRVEQLHGSLLLCHGVADDNVHPQNTFEYSDALVKANKDFRELLYTNKNHSIYGGNTRNHLLSQIASFFQHELAPQKVSK